MALRKKGTPATAAMLAAPVLVGPRPPRPPRPGAATTNYPSGTGHTGGFFSFTWGHFAAPFMSHWQSSDCPFLLVGILYFGIRHHRL